MTLIRVKVTNKNNITRSFKFAAPTEIPNEFISTLQLKQLQKIVMQLFSLDHTPTISFMDDENERVQIGSDQELALACSLAKQSLRILIDEIESNNIVEPQSMIVKQIKQESNTISEQPLSIEKYCHSKCRVKHQKDLKPERMEQKLLKLKEKLQICDESKKVKIQKKIERIESKKASIMSTDQTEPDIKSKNPLEEISKIKEEKRQICKQKKLKETKSIDEIVEWTGQQPQKEKQDRLTILNERLLTVEDENKRLKLLAKIELVKIKKAEKEHKIMLKEQKKAEKRAQKEQKIKERELFAAEDYLLDQGWPDTIKKLYLDGNNMLFVSKYLRDLALKRNKAQAERVLSELARNFGQVQNLALTHVIFDKTTSIERGDTFVVSSASSQYQTSDDALIEIAKQASNVKVDSCLFVTSDCKLRKRLREIGAKVIKPKQWFAFTLQRIKEVTQIPYKDVDHLLESFDSK